MATYDPKKLRFWPSVFRDNGYETACIGKWHLGDDIGHDRDWDYSVIWDRGAGNAGAYYHNTLVRTNGGERKPLGGYSTDRFTELAVDYINEKKEVTTPGISGSATVAFTAPIRPLKDMRQTIKIRQMCLSPQTSFRLDLINPTT